MRNLILTGLTALATIGTLSACDSFVEDIDQPIDRVDSDSLDNQVEIDFLITGVKEGFNDAYDNVATISELLSDNAIFNQRVRNATFPTYGDVDEATIEFDNNTVDGVSNTVNEYRLLADDLLRRIDNTIEFSDDTAGASAERRARYAANFHGAVARYFLATYFSPDGQNGGAPISIDRDNPTEVIPAAELYTQALGKLDVAEGQAQIVVDDADATASAVASAEYDIRVIHSLRARIELFSGDRGAAAVSAADGLVAGDDPYVARYTLASSNNWFANGGRGRTQISISPVFADLDTLDNRDLVEVAPNASRSDDNTYYRQSLYETADAPLPFLTWQETALIRAEAALLEDSDADAAEALVNPVLADRGLAEIGGDDDDLDQEDLIQIRRRELFTYGLRLVDQRRFDLPFTRVTYPAASGEAVEVEVPGTFRYLPLTQTERNANPNL